MQCEGASVIITVYWRLYAGHAFVAAVPLPGKAYTMSAAGQRLVVGTSGRHVLIFDVRR